MKNAFIATKKVIFRIVVRKTDDPLGRGNWGKTKPAKTGKAEQLRICSASVYGVNAKNPKKLTMSGTQYQPVAEIKLVANFGETTLATDTL